MIGGYDYAASQFDRASEPRPATSAAFKPFYGRDRDAAAGPSACRSVLRTLGRLD